ncbi:MAG: hypothetical protein E7663_01320 [Ruminococcaceae bacterium]|nr:hypothetical protein [Oscillospiraceae bacterium]
MQNKNKMNGKRLFIVAIALLLLVVFTLGGSTFAKYITTKVMPTKQATVAKWGHVITINAEDLFGTDYTKGQQGTYAEIVEADTGVAVNASATSNVVAPGTTGSMTFTIAGTAEVLSKLNVTATGTDIELKANVTKNTEQAAAVTYSPVKWTLVFAPAAGGNNQTLVDAGTLTACVAAINALNGQVADAMRLLRAQAPTPFPGRGLLTIPL